MSEMDQEPYWKEQFANFIASGFTPFIAALKLWGQERVGEAYHYAQLWQNDPYVLEVLASKKKAKEEENKPKAKERLIKTIEDSANSMSDDNKIKAWRLISEMQGYIEKAAPPTVNVNNAPVTNRVMIVRDHGTDDQWEDKMRAQQAKLVNG